MVYKYYKCARDAAWVILSAADPTFFPLMMSNICKSLGVDIQFCNHIEKDGGGRAVFYDGYYSIYVDETLPCDMKRFVAAHELGHIVLGHLEQNNGIPETEKTGKDAPAEKEADAFAMRLTMPLCILWACRVESAEETVRLFGVPLQYAKKRYKRYLTVKERELFLMKDIERDTFRTFGGFINGYRRAKNLPSLNIDEIIKKAELRFDEGKSETEKANKDKKTDKKTAEPSKTEAPVLPE